MNSGYDFQKCIGLTVKPRQGDGLLFYSTMVNSTIDPVRALVLGIELDPLFLNVVDHFHYGV